MKKLILFLLLTTPLFSQLYTGRHYDAPITPSEANEIEFIVTTLADKPYTKLIFYRSQLQNAGARVDHVHPLKFCAAIFSNPKLVVGMHNIRKKHLVWREFSAGLADSFSQEVSLENLSDDQISDFASHLEIDPSSLYPLARGQRWESFLVTLIDLVPRNDDHDRYSDF